PNSDTPVDVTGLGSGVAGIAGGGFHSCAVMSGGSLKCWGDDGNGQLGDGNTAPEFAPVDVAGIANAVSVDAAASSSCALSNLGGVQCWGWNGSVRCSV